MPSVEGYDLSQVAFSENGVQFIRGHSVKDDKEKLLHVVTNINEKQGKKYRNYFLRSLQFQHQSLINYELKIEDENQMIFVTDLSHYNCLSKLLREQYLPLETALKFAIQLISGLKVIHDKGYCHSNIHINNILVSSQLNDVKWYAHTLPRHVEQGNHLELVQAPEIEESSLNSIDPRADFYSFGVTLFQMIAGPALPDKNFLTTNLFKSLSRGGDIKPYLPDDTPKSVYRLLSKLLSSDPGYRYQNCDSLLNDLTRISQDPNNNNLTFAQYDLPVRLHTPSGIYGRDVEVLEVFKSYQETTNGNTSLLSISGYSGIGKTSVVDRAHQLYFTEFCLYAKGKFDQISRRTPYSAFLQSLNHVIEKILLLPKQERRVITSRIQSAIGEHINLLTSSLPLLNTLMENNDTNREKISGNLTYESDYQFKGSLIRLLKCFCSLKRPLVIFLDDMQWADDASLAFLTEFLLENTQLPILVICAYRSNELKDASSLDRFLINTREGLNSFKEIELTPLNRDGVTSLLTDVLSLKDDDLKQLLKVVIDKTGSNPFFILQLLSHLISNKCIEYNRGEACWSVNFDSIKELNIADNVVELVRNKIDYLPRITANKIKILSFLGHEISLEDFSEIIHIDKSELMVQLQPAANESLLTFTSNPKHQSSNAISCHFSHDRIQQGAHELVDPKVSLRLHKKIGFSFLNILKRDQNDKYLFNALEHLNQAKQLITENDIRVELAKLNLTAANKSKRSLAYEESIEFCKHGCQYLAPHSEDTILYNLTLTLCDALFLSGQGKAIEEHYEFLIKNSKDASQEARVVLLYVKYWASIGDFRKSLEAGLNILEKFSVSMPDINSSLSEINQHYKERTIEFKNRLGGRKIPELFDVALNQDPTEWTIIKIFSEIIDCALNSVPMYTRLITISMVNRGLEKGHTPYSSLGYVFQGMVMVSLKEDFEQAYELGALAVRLNEERTKNDDISCKLITAYATDLYHIKNSLQDSPYFYEAAYLAGLEQRDHVWCSYALVNECRALLSAGSPLNKVITTIIEREPVLLSFNATTMFDLLQVFKGLAYALSEKDRTDLNHKEFTEKRFLNTYDEQSPLILSWYRFLKIKLSFLLGSYHHHDELPSIDSINVHEEYIEGSFYQCIIEIKDQHKEITLNRPYSASDLEDKVQHIHEIAKCNPKNFMTYSSLLSAEISKKSDNKNTTKSLYEKAIHDSHISGLTYQRALSYHLAGDYHYQDGNMQLALLYLHKASQAYDAWGAYNISHHLHRHYSGCSWKDSKLVDSSIPTEAILPADDISMLPSSNLSTVPPALEELLTLIDQLSIQSEQGTVSQKALASFIKSARTKGQELSKNWLGNKEKNND